MPKKKLGRPLKDSPDLIKARSRWAEGRYDEALRSFDKALRRQPNHPLALADAARAFGARFEAAKAESILAHLEKLAGLRPDLLLMAAKSYMVAHRPLAAVRCCERVLTNHPDHPGANYELALLMERCGEIGRAQEGIERFLHATPDSNEGKLARARLLRRGGGTGGMADDLLRELREPGVVPLVRSEAYALTAAALEREGKFDEAFETMLEGKSILERISSAARQAAENIDLALHRLSTGLTAKNLERWARAKLDPDEASLPVALITAPCRSGASLLARILAAHPALAVSDDVSAFSEEILPGALLSSASDKPEHEIKLLDKLPAPARIAAGLRYRRLLLDCLGRPASAPPPQFLIDSSPGNTALAAGFLRIVPQGQLIVPLRDPRDILVSSLFCHLPVSRTSVAFLHPFDAAERIAFELECWLRLRELLDGDRWIEVRYEDLTSDFAAETQHVLHHLGIGWDEAAIGGYLEAAGRRPARHASDVATTQPIHQRSVARWENYEEQLHNYFEELDPLLGRLGYA